MNVEIKTVATQFLIWKYLFHIFCIVSFQCKEEGGSRREGVRDDFMSNNIIFMEHGQPYMHELTLTQLLYAGFKLPKED
jgi:hypothetical protein